MSGIEWTERSWSPIRGCSRLSEGCRNCWASRQANRMRGGAYKGFVENSKWTGRVELIPDQLDKPLRWRKPRRIAVALMGDLFHEALFCADIAAVFGVMSACPQHTFQLLTKRPGRIGEFLEWLRPQATAWAGPTPESELCRHRARKDGAHEYMERAPWPPPAWPLPNVHLGVSVEDQATADERIPLLLQTPAAVRWVSLEPLLESVDIEKHRMPGPQLNWVVIGGESGPGARRCDVEWIRSAVEQCQLAGIPAFVKQLGANIRDRNDAGWEGIGPEDWPEQIATDDRVEHDINGFREDYQGASVRVRLRDRKGADPAEWPSDLRIRQFPR